MVKYMKKFKKDIIQIGLIIAVVVLIRVFLFTPARVAGDSMFSTLKNNEIVLVNKIGYTLNGLKRFDIAVFELENGERLIKRVIGLPGEKIEYKDNILYINDEEVKSDLEFNETEDFVKEEIAEDTYFLLGDNRDDSTDSREFGTIESESIIGKVNFVIYPFNHFGKVK